MNYQISFDKSPSYVELQWQGEVYIDELLEAFGKIVKDKRYSKGLNFLIDYRNATPMLVYQDLETLAQFASKAPAKYRSAAVMKDKIDLRFADIWREYSVHVGIEEFGCFLSYEQAAQWLEQSKPIN